jgi:hypothetical protein
VLKLYHGGTLDEPGATLWATSDPDYAAAFAQLHEGDLWTLNVDIQESEILDLTSFGLNVSAVASALTARVCPVSNQADDEGHPQCVLRRVPAAAIRAAGYRAVRLRERIDWGTGDRHAESHWLVDMTAITCRRAVPLPDRNFHVG